MFPSIHGGIPAAIGREVGYTSSLSYSELTAVCSKRPVKSESLVKVVYPQIH